VLVRDYGLYDHAMLRFAPGHKLADSFYVRQDGTRAYYFSKGKLIVVEQYELIIILPCNPALYCRRSTKPIRL